MNIILGILMVGKKQIMKLIIFFGPWENEFLIKNKGKNEFDENSMKYFPIIIFNTNYPDDNDDDDGRISLISYFYSMKVYELKLINFRIDMIMLSI